MGFNRDALPDPGDYYTGQGLTLIGRGPWRTTECHFHGGSDSMRVNVRSGAFCCMAGCGARGGDVLSYHVAAHGLNFTTAARALGAWTDGGRPPPRRPTPLSWRDALTLLEPETTYLALMATHMAVGRPVEKYDAARMRIAAGRVALIRGMCS